MTDETFSHVPSKEGTMYPIDEKSSELLTKQDAMNDTELQWTLVAFIPVRF